jgi:hypothetical protein
VTTFTLRIQQLSVTLVRLVEQGKGLSEIPQLNSFSGLLEEAKATITVSAHVHGVRVRRKYS